MNPRIAKEIRVLLPAFGLTLAAAVLPLLFGPNRHEIPEIWMGLLFVLGCIIMGAEIFGNEFQQKTLPLLLTQPIPRTSIWREKMLVLGVALAVGTGVLGIAVMLFDRQLVSAADFSWISWGMILLGVFGTVPYWTLLFRNTLVGGVVAVVAPGFILGVNSWMHQQWIQNGNSIFKGWFTVNSYIHQRWVQDPTAEESSVITLLLLYSAACCWLGYDRFKKLQVVDAHSMAASRELGLPPRFEAMLLWPFRILSTGFTGPLASLIKKELRVQQFTFLGTALFCLMAVVAVVLREWIHVWVGRLLIFNFFFYLAVLPLIAGAVSVAEEKAWGVADWHLSLPPSALKQWSAKLLVALGTSLVLGLVLPVGLALAGAALFGNQDSAALPRLHALRSVLNLILVGTRDAGNSLAPMSVALAFLFCVVLGQMLLTSVAIYAGCIVSTTARALVLALGLSIAAGILVKTGASFALGHWDPQFQITNALGHGADRGQIQMSFFGLLAAEMFVLLCLIHTFAYRCYRGSGLTQRLIRIQWPTLVLVLLFLTIIFVFVTFSGILWR